MEQGRRFSVIVDGRVVREGFEPDEEPIRLDAWAGYVEIRDADSDELVATLPMMDLADLEEGPWTTPVDLRSGDRMTLTVSATPSSEEDGLPDLALHVRHETAQEAEPAGFPRMGLTAAVLLVLGAFGAGWAVNGLWGKAPLRQVTSNEPPSVKFSAVGQRRLQLRITGKTETVAEVYVDWGDRADPDPVGGTRVFEQIGAHSGGPPAPVIHDYPAIVGPEGLRAVARAAVVAVGSSPPPPGTPIEERLIPLQPLLVLPYGIVLDPPPPRLSIVTPGAGDIVPALTEVRLEMDSITADVHLFGADQSDQSIYHHLGSLPAPRSAKHAGAQVVDTARLGEQGSFDVVAVSTNEIDAAVGAAVPWYDIPSAAPITEIELRHAGVIIAPTAGSVVSEVGIEPVRAKVLLPDRYAVVAVRPRKEGHYWIQNDPLSATPFVEFAVQASFGGWDRYDIWLGITEDQHLTKAGDRLEQLGRTDPEGRPVHWVGPVEVSRSDR